MEVNGGNEFSMSSDKLHTDWYCCEKTPQQALKHITTDRYTNELGDFRSTDYESQLFTHASFSSKICRLQPDHPNTSNPQVVVQIKKVDLGVTPNISWYHFTREDGVFYEISNESWVGLKPKMEERYIDVEECAECKTEVWTVIWERIDPEGEGDPVKVIKRLNMIGMTFDVLGSKPKKLIRKGAKGFWRKARASDVDLEDAFESDPSSDDELSDAETITPETYLECSGKSRE